MANKIVRETIHAKGIDIGIYTNDFENEYISLTDIAKYRNDNDPRFVIQNWMRNRNTVEFLAVWEELHNPDFNRVQFEAVRSEAGLNRFVMTPTKWIEQTNAIGIVSKAGRYGGGTYAHSDIAMAFATWISPEFQLYIMKDYRRLKQDENSRLSLDWNLNRALSKVNYRIHTDAVKENLIPPELTPEQIAYTYANEADLLNVALFGQTAKQWKNNNPGKKGNVRDDANLNQLLVLANMESYNAILIEQGKSQSERLILLRNLAIKQIDGYSLDAQKTKMKAFCDYNEYEIAGEYEDAGKSGKSIEGRVSFNQMMEDIKSGKDGVSYVLVFKLSRFGKNAADVLATLQVMQDFGVNLICVEDGIDSSRDAGKLMISVLSAVAEIERENIRVQTMEGKWNGGFAPYGYSLIDGKLEVNEEEASLIRRIIQNPVYSGKISYGRRRTEKVHGTRNEYRQVKKDDYLLVDGLNEALVSEEVWE